MGKGKISMKFFKSRKGIAIDDMLPLLFVVIAFIVLILMFTYSYSKEGKEIDYELNKIEMEIMAYDFLQKFLSTELLIDLNAPIDVSLPGKFVRMNMAELINLYYHDDTYEDILIIESKIILESFPKPSESSSWNIAIYSGGHLIKSIRTIKSSEVYPTLITSINIPLISKTGEHLQIRMYEIHKVERTVLKALP